MTVEMLAELPRNHFGAILADRRGRSLRGRIKAKAEAGRRIMAPCPTPISNQCRSMV